MHILHLIGNGFDIAMGLKTGYQDFYDHYLATNSTDPAVAKMKDYLKAERYNTWADLEKGLGLYTAKVENAEEMKQVFYDISDSLKAYLKRENDSFSVSSDALNNSVMRSLIDPQNALAEGMMRSLTRFRGSSSSTDTVNIISFNYTNTLERICRFRGTGQVKFQSGSHPGYLLSIRHIHMSLNDMDVIMGVNDESQIVGKEILDDQIRSMLIKPYINEQLQTLVDEECKSLIDSADLICLFGVSVGETDLLWWKRIGRRMASSSARLIYFAYDRDNVRRNNELIDKVQYYRSLLLDRLGLSKTEVPGINSRLFVGYKRDVFKNS